MILSHPLQAGWAYLLVKIEPFNPFFIPDGMNIKSDSNLNVVFSILNLIQKHKRETKTNENKAFKNTAL